MRFAVLGGDVREKEAARYLWEQGVSLSLWGLEWEGDDPRVQAFSEASRALEGAQAVLAPVKGLDARNALYGAGDLVLTSEDLGALEPGTPFFIGRANSWLRGEAKKRGFRLIELLERDDFSIYNSIPTAEGAIGKAMAESDVCLFGSQCFVLGFGRTGQTIARALAGLGARVTACSRDRGELARAYTLGYRTLPLSRLADHLEEADFVFNTIPALVLTGEKLSLTRPEVVIVDIASAPGGTDFAAARELDRKAFLVPGLPAKVAPRTAGRLLGQVVFELAGEMTSPALESWSGMTRQ